LRHLELVGKVIIFHYVRHKAALENAKKAGQTMRELFKVAFEFCKDQRRRVDLSGSANST